jgi:hypothetical protein
VCVGSDGVGCTGNRVIVCGDIDRLDEQFDITRAGHPERPRVLVAKRERHTLRFAGAQDVFRQLDGTAIDTASDGDGSHNGALIVDPH